jgi:hypothetical protein
VAVFLGWTSEAVPPGLFGPWTELHVAAPGLVLIDSAESLSRVYHELKWALPPNAALIVAPIAGVPKLKGLAPGTLSWLRARS